MLYLAQGESSTIFTWANLRFVFSKSPRFERVKGVLRNNLAKQIDDLQLNECLNLQLYGTVFNGSDQGAILVVPNSVQQFNTVDLSGNPVWGYTICSKGVHVPNTQNTVWYVTAFVLPSKVYAGDVCTHSLLPPYYAGYSNGIYGANVVRAVGSRNWSEDSKAYNLRVILTPAGAPSLAYWSHDANTAVGVVSYYDCVVDWRTYSSSQGPLYGIYPDSLVGSWAYQALGDLNRKAEASPITCLVPKNGGRYEAFFTYSKEQIRLDSGLTAEYVTNTLNKYVDERGVGFLGFDPFDFDAYGWHDMAYDAYNSVQFYNGNGVALFNDLREMREGVSSLLNTIRSLGAGKWSAIAKLYLTFHYGYKLLMLDTEELTRELLHYDSLKSHRCKCQKGKSTVAIGHGGTWSLNVRYQVYFDLYGQLTSDFEKLIDLFDIDVLDPTIWWDLTPYSFVVDWFINVGDVLEAIQIDSEMRNKHKVTTTSRSAKAECRTVKIDNFTVCAKYYERHYSPRLITPTLNATFNPNLSPQHWVEGAALAVSAL